MGPMGASLSNMERDDTMNDEDTLMSCFLAYQIPPPPSGHSALV